MGADRKCKEIGIISDTTLHRHLLQSAVISANYKVGYIHDPGKKELKDIPFKAIGVWLVDLSDEDEWADLIAEIIEHSEAPVLFGDSEVPQHGTPPYNRWKKRLLAKISDHIGEPVTFSQPVHMANQAAHIPSQPAHIDSTDENIGSVTLPTKKPIKPPLPREFENASDGGESEQRVWVLAASLGGPAAVKEFLDYLPDGLPVAFILAQHIDGNFQTVLSQVLARNTQYTIINDCDNKKVTHGNMYVLSVEHAVSFSVNGTIIPSDEAWEGLYSPSIDQVIGAVAERWKDQSGAIIFSGMGEDGTKTVLDMHEYGGIILAQDQKSCANSCMPDAIRETGCVTYSGSPQQLAYQFVDLIRKQMPVAS